MTQSRTRTAAQAQALLPSDADLWKHRKETWPQVESWTGLSDNTLSKYLAPRGWKRNPGKVGGWGHAPCELCRKSFRIEPGQTKRRCPGHMDTDALPAVEKTDYQKELQAYLKRSKNGEVAHLRRPYSNPPEFRNRILPYEMMGGWVA